ncbi:MAG: hypothetical protein WA414_08000, partial [Acidobacteriaceae bacterium]
MSALHNYQLQGGISGAERVKQAKLSLPTMQAAWPGLELKAAEELDHPAVVRAWRQAEQRIV